MTSPPINELAYESWLIRRMPNNSLRVLYAAVARGPAAVLVPLPWGEVRILDEVHDRTAFWRLYAIVVPWWQAKFFAKHPELKGRLIGYSPPGPVGSRDAGVTGEQGARLVSRDELTSELASHLPSTWEFAQRFLHWPAQPPRRGLAAWLSRTRARELAPVALLVEGALSADREHPRFELTVATCAEQADIYLIDPEWLVCVPGHRVLSDPYHGTGMTLPGLVDPKDHVHWKQVQTEAPHASRNRFQRYGDAEREFIANLHAPAPKM
jgi:hypothetical protein